MSRTGAAVETGVVDADSRLTLRGELDPGAVPEIAWVLAHSRWSGRLDVVVDLAEVCFVDSTGVEMLMAARRHLAHLGGTIRFVGVSDDIRRVLVLCGLEVSPPQHSATLSRTV